jgi:predicted outer membrane repeat protein
MYPRVSSRVFLATCSFLLVSLPLSFRISSARTWNVFGDGSGEAPTVQAGIDSAASEDTVLVHPGTYSEPINFGAKNVVLRSQSGPAETILDGTGLATAVVTINQGQNRAAKLEGFTITHGSGGVFIFDAGPSVIGNVITGNGGRGITCNANANTAWFPLIQDNTITNNLFATNGAGIATQPGVVPEILDNHIAGNNGSDGGAIYTLLSASGAVIRGNTVLNNQAINDGGGIYVEYASSAEAFSVEISWNLVSGNFARGADFTGTGCGIDLVGTQAWVHHNTIVGNDGDGAHTRIVAGGGIAIYQSGSPAIEQNVIAFNRAGGGIWCDPNTTPLIRNNFAWQNEDGDVLGCSTTWQSDGNVIDNPYFCDSAIGDFSVAPNSGVMTHPAGPLGSFPNPGCGPVTVRHSTWGSLKARY